MANPQASGRGRRNNNRRRPNNNRNRGGNRGGGGGEPREKSYSTNRRTRGKQPTLQLSGWEKFLSVITFGFYGRKLEPKLTNRPPSAEAGERPPRGEGGGKPAREERQRAKNAVRRVSSIPGAGDEDGDASAEGAGERPRRERKKRERKPIEARPEDVNSGRLYVGNLSFDATESDLVSLFSGVGSVRNAEVVAHQRTQRSKGYAFVEMASVDEAKRAVETLHNQEFMGRPLLVSGAKSSGWQENNDSESNEAEESAA